MMWRFTFPAAYVDPPSPDGLFGWRVFFPCGCFWREGVGSRELRGLCEPRQGKKLCLSRKYAPSPPKLAA